MFNLTIHCPTLLRSSIRQHRQFMQHVIFCIYMNIHISYCQTTPHSEQSIFNIMRQMATVLLLYFIAHRHMKQFTFHIEKAYLFGIDCKSLSAKDRISNRLLTTLRHRRLVLCHKFVYYAIAINKLFLVSRKLRHTATSLSFLL